VVYVKFWISHNGKSTSEGATNLEHSKTSLTCSVK